ncbi:MAG: hypothetical protein ACRD16_17320 [Thermoanaerobaculia bacterium]
MRKTLGSIVLLALAAAARADEPFDTSLLRNRLWDDGKAEYNVYRAEEVREGFARRTEVVHIVVKEPFNPRLRVKADAPTGIEVLKMNQVINVPAGVYAFHQMHSSFWDRATGALLKFSMSSNDSCGNTFKLGWLDGESLRLTYHTYWDGEGDGVLEQKLPAGVLFEDELPFKLRTLRRTPESADYRIVLYPSVIGSRLGHPQPRPATIAVTSSGNERRIEVRSDSGIERFVFDRAFPYTLKSWTRPDGSSLTLRRAQRLDYWNHGRPGDERLLE